MSVASKRVFGWSLVVIGLGIVIFSHRIVFPGLEAVLGIETIVGRENVVYEPDGSYMFTNPDAMVRWTLSVAAVGVMLACGGALLLFRGRRTRSV